MAGIIQQVLADAKSESSKQRKRYIEKLIDYYSGTDTWRYIGSYFDADSFNEIPVYDINVTKKFIDKKSRVYTLSPTREIDNSKNKTDQYSKLTRKKDLKMKHIERITNLVGVPALRVLWDEDEDGNFFDYNCIYYYDAIFDESNPYDPVAIVYPILAPTNDVTYLEKSKYAYWDAEVYMVFDEDGNVEYEEDNPYGVLPFVFPRSTVQIDDFYGEGASDIVSVNEHINIAMTELMLGLRFQMFGQPWASGVYQDSPLARMGTDMIINLPEGGAFGIETPGGNLGQVIEVIKFKLELLAMSQHMYVTFESNQDRPSSGLALKIKDFEHVQDYKDDLELWRDFEKKLYNLEKIIATSNNTNLGSSLIVDFKEPEYPVSVQEQITKDNWDLDNGLITLEEIYKRDRSDISIEEARAIIEKNKGEQDAEEVESQEAGEEEKKAGFKAV